MDAQLFHIFRNTPLGRETLLQSIYFCKKIGASLIIYIPEFTKFLMYFENDVVQIDLDGSYLTSPETALKHAKELLDQGKIKARFLDPKNFTASTLPDIATNFDFMCCPRSISDLASKIGLGYIGPRVRRIVNSARFPVLITSPVFKKWRSIAVFFGGSANAINALKLAFRLSRASEMPLSVYTHMENVSRESYEEIIKNENLEEEMDRYVTEWHMFESGKFEENIYDVPHDALVVMGAYGHSLIRNIFFGGKMEKIQSTITNNLLIAGPNYTLTR
ncbi:MAG: universal stress protein [Proteobacteria bacterium]|nr:universal stress protein [Pseudomonadota bacterium]MCG2830555.1 universal stress protein [Desulfobacteraceae bacterium]MBU4209172.1 universal stress protein [Pseudomonadota bacterium]MBU4388638.1 universal stress protein [Pseudomonadota bacterium]MBU4419748.1 universal stress protein [Pseudomonadota bacterium]